MARYDRDQRSGRYDRRGHCTPGNGTGMDSGKLPSKQPGDILKDVDPAAKHIGKQPYDMMRKARP